MAVAMYVAKTLFARLSYLPSTVCHDPVAFCSVICRPICYKKAVLPQGNRAMPPLFFFGFYRSMHFSAKRGIAIACRLSVCLSVCL